MGAQAQQRKRKKRALATSNWIKVLEISITQIKRFMVLNQDRSHGVERWPRGGQYRITPPSLDDHNRYNGKAVVAAFHTHPNPPVDEAGRVWEQGPSASDRRWHRRRKLRGFVVSRMFVHEIDVERRVSVAGNRDEVLSA